ncbi:MAG: N-6 DNA methylase [Prevotellaceae bacterium]|nr:N-6 DNA methylase [Prevotellaceae bacterium]
MASKAKTLAKAISNAPENDSNNIDALEFNKLLNEFQKDTDTEISTKCFSDFCAQIVVFGLFIETATETDDNEKSRTPLFDFYPLYRKVFNFVFKNEANESIKNAANDIVDLFSQMDKKSVLENLNKSCANGDPNFDFYEIFLSEYDGIARKAAGVWYTPQPVVDFIVRAVDEILRTDFHMEKGLADTSTTKDGKPTLQIFDPATGTGTFLVGVINRIYKKYNYKNPEEWASYVQNHLLHSIEGAELSMIPFALSHWKIGMTLKKTGYNMKPNDKLRIFLKNTLETEHA